MKIQVPNRWTLAVLSGASRRNAATSRSSAGAGSGSTGPPPHHPGVEPMGSADWGKAIGELPLDESLAVHIENLAGGPLY